MTQNLLLIHGAWQGGWAWGALLPHLRSYGWICHPIDLPGSFQPGAPPGPATLAGYVAHCAAIMPERAVVIGHSGGGAVASQLAEDYPDRVAALVYIAGMMLPSGVDFPTLVRDSGIANTSGIVPHLVWSDDGQVSSVPPAAALEIFLHDCPREAAQAAALRLTPQATSGLILQPRLTAERYGQVRRIYVEATEDRSVVLGIQRHMQALSQGAEIVTMQTGHVPQLADPQHLAALLDEVLSRPAPIPVV